ncbi:MAG: ABC transporter substrate-binding protein [Actinobacteria bacterium]|nr:ABC transporter substrate-binding protein [Actinomycetota bacterium]
MLRRLPTMLASAIITATLATACASTPADLSSTPPDTQPSAASSIAPDVITISSADVPMPEPQPASPMTGGPQRIVSLATGVGETLAALGVADRVVGRDETSNVPQIADAPVVTKAHAASAERVLATNPDLVIIDAATSPSEVITQLRDSGVTVVEVPEAWTLDDIAPRTQAVADAAGVPTAVADAVIAEATAAAAPSSSASGTRPRVAFLYLRGTSAIYLVGGRGSGADALIAAAGGTDAGADAGLAAFVPLTAESVAMLNPDVILVMTKGLESVGGIDGLVALPGVAQTTAGRDRRVIAVDDTLLLSFGPRTGRLVDQLASAIGRLAP